MLQQDFILFFPSSSQIFPELSHKPGISPCQCCKAAQRKCHQPKSADRLSFPPAHPVFLPLMAGAGNLFFRQRCQYVRAIQQCCRITHIWCLLQSSFLTLISSARITSRLVFSDVSNSIRSCSCGLCQINFSSNDRITFSTPASTITKMGFFLPFRNRTRQMIKSRQDSSSSGPAG